MKKEIRPEQKIFSELEKLCSSKGYLHVIAYFCYRDNNIKYEDKISIDEALSQYSPKRLLRNEISTLIAFVCKNEINTELPSPYLIQKYIDDTEKLLEELHHAVVQPAMDSIYNKKTQEINHSVLRSGKMLREAIFYGSESAHEFQYRDLSQLKYEKDNDWLVNTKGFSIQQACDIASAIQKIQNNKINNLISKKLSIDINKLTFLPIHIFSVDEISLESKVEPSIVKNFIQAFVNPDNKSIQEFSAIGDFNPINAYPIVKISETEFVLFQPYNLAEALYETPSFWMLSDKLYQDKAGINKGEFVESFSQKRLEHIFGKDRVFSNINIHKNKSTKISEIDILVTFANRAIVLQAKAKKLTIKARQGDDYSKITSVVKTASPSRTGSLGFGYIASL